MKTVYGVLSGISKSQRALMQMIARCKKVEEQTINGLNDQMIQTNDNHKFWTFRYVNETRNNTIYGQPYITEGGRLRLGSNHDEQ